MNTNNSTYYLGLDLGTNSIGWAVTDTEYSLIRKKGKDLWGIREFEEGEFAYKRTFQRLKRRRRQREQVRLGLLRSYFADDIKKVDPDFFVRIDNSKFLRDDKEIDSLNAVFDDEKYQDKDYYHQFPTIYHLRKELIENPNKHDVRLVYLAVASMFRHRGHFWSSNANQKINKKSGSELLLRFFDIIEKRMGTTIAFNSIGKVEEAYFDLKKTKGEKCADICKILGIGVNQERERELIKLVCGLEVNTQSLFGIVPNKKICFSKKNYVEETQELIHFLGRKYFDVIDSAKEVYDLLITRMYLNNSDYISFLKVDIYNKHKKDLRILKDVIRKYCPERYDSLFRGMEAGSYSCYINSSNSCGKKKRRNMGGRKDRSIDEFYSNIMSTLSEFDDELIDYIKTEISKRFFIPKLRTIDNSIIPNYVYADELDRIINNASKYVSFLNEISDGITYGEKIRRLFTFQIPFYIGPITEQSALHGGNGWVKRKKQGTVFPWNFDEMIDEEECAKRYILQRVKQCSYMYNEKTEPRNSLLYQKFCILDEINNIRINGVKISVDIKQKIFDELYLKSSKVTREEIAKYLIKNGYISCSNQMSGIDKEVKNNYTTYHLLKPILGEQIANEEWVDRIVYYITLFSVSDKLRKKKIIELCKEELNETQIHMLCDLNFRGWGSLSREILLLKEDDAGRSVIDNMWSTNASFIETVTSCKYKFAAKIKEKRDKAIRSINDINYDDIKSNTMTMAANKICWETIKVLRDIIHVMGCTPQSVYIEVNRYEGKKGELGRSERVEDKFINYFRKVPNRDYWEQEIKKASNRGLLKNRRIQLYFLQMGKDMYTGMPMDMEDVLNESLYDIDHIYPKSQIRDESIENNLVLVNKQENARKEDEYPLSKTIRNNPKIRKVWLHLRKYNLMSVEKYNRLCSINPISNEQKEEFLREQLVEMSQAAMQVKNVFQGIMPEANIRFVKANSVSELRRKYDLPKSRFVNDFHHANDAYLSIVVGNAFFTKFGSDPHWFVYHSNRNYNIDKFYDEDIKEDDVVGWISGEEGTVYKIREVLSKNTPLLSRKAFVGHGGIFDETIYSANKAIQGVYLPLKTRDKRLLNVSRYGGYKSATTAYFFLVEHLCRKGIVKTLESVPIYLKDKIGTDRKLLEVYCKNILGLENVRIVVPKIKLQSLFMINGFYLHISGKTENRISFRNAVQLCLDMEWVKYVSLIEKNKMCDQITLEKNCQLYRILAEKHTSSIFAKKPTPMGSMLLQGYGLFENLTLEEQCKCLKQILKLTQIGMTEADLSVLGGGKRSGIIKLHKNITNLDSIYLINQSSTGIFESRINLLIL